MLITPSDHFRLHETLVTSSRALGDFIQEVTDIASATDCKVYWRGQADHRWGVTSSLARLANTPTALRDDDLQAAEDDILAEAKEWVTAAVRRPSNDLEWLALLQHHGVPTRMLDFTKDAFVATFFAVESLDDIEGRLIAVAVPRNAGMHVTAPAGFSVGDLGLGELRIWEPRRAVSPRLAAQNGVFALGRLPSTAPARHVHDSMVSDSERLMTRAEVASVLSLPLYMVSTTRGANRRATNYPSCFTARIHVDKSTLRDQLAKRTSHGALRPSGSAINHASCYPDVDGLAAQSSVLARVRRGLA